MSYGPHTKNPYEDDQSPLDDADRSPCACHRSGCWIDGNDASNVLVNGKWYAAECAATLPEVLASVEADRQADDDAFNRVRR